MALPLIAAQPGIWLADKLSSYDNAYTVVHYLDLTGRLNVDVLCDAIMQVMNETDTLRMSYSECGGEVVQIKDGALPLPSPELWDFRRDSNPLESSRNFMQQDMDANVRIDSGNQLIRHAILQISENKWMWYQRYHHIQLDAFSFTALTRRMVDVYSARIRGSKDAVMTQPFQPFEGVVQEYENYQSSEKCLKDAKFWKDYCKGLPDAASPSVVPLTGEEPSKNILRSSIFLNKDHINKLFQHAETCGMQSADIALALIAVWILRISNRESMSAGFIFMRRLGSAALNTAGPFINVLPMSLSLTESNGRGRTLVEVAKAMNKTLKLLRRHQRYDSEKIVRDSGRNWDNNPLFGPVINYKAFDYRLDFENVESATHHLASGPIRDIEIVLYMTEDGNVQVEYLANANRYDAESLNTHLDRLPLLLEQFVSDPERDCSKARIILPSEIQMIEEANNTDVQLDGNDTLVNLLQKQVRLTPDATALQDSNFTLTYLEMQTQVTLFANILLSQGVRSGDIIAIALPRSVLLSIALQAIISVGATWLPLDVGYPEERLTFMIQDAKPRLIVTSSDWVEKTDRECIILDTLLSKNEIGDTFATDNASPDGIAYMIYTSGSTGKPKGVQISHRAIVNRLLWMQSEYNLNSSDAVLQKTPSSFDVSVWELFWPLMTGARLVMAPPDAHRDPEKILELVVKYGITTIHFVPSMMSTFLSGTQAGDVSGKLRRTFCSGEALSTSLAQKWQRVTGVPLFNLYGPTEAAIDVTSFPAADARSYSLTFLPIGKPVWNTKMWVLDSRLNAVPPGMAGNLYISGVQLAAGYLNRPELTSERFIFVNGRRLYSTGDVARWLPLKGVLEFLGRSDDQIKLRGQRIELGEIDRVMERIPGISEAVTHPQILLSGSDKSNDSGDARQLVGYIVPNKACELDLNAVEQELRRILPAYMVPAKLMVLDKLPISATGKLDRRALPLPTATANQNGVARREPETKLEKVIAEAYKELLGCENISAEDDFFSLGGHSLLAVRLAALLRKRLDLPVNIGQIMSTSKISALAEQLSDESNRQSWRDAGFEGSLALRVNPNKSGGTLFCIHPASGFSWQFSVLQRYIDPYWSLLGIQSAYTDGVLAKSETLDDVVNAHFERIVKYQPEGPYYLLGYSLGGTLAHSLAAKLRNSGRDVAFLGLLDTWPPETQNWDEKRGKNVVDEAVIDEMYRERQQFVNAQQGMFDSDEMSNRLFDTIEHNYESAVRLLATAHSSRFEGKATLFVAKRTFPEGTDLQQVWRPWVAELVPVPVDCSHVDIISPQTFETLGPELDRTLRQFMRQ